MEEAQFTLSLVVDTICKYLAWEFSLVCFGKLISLVNCLDKIY